MNEERLAPILRAWLRLRDVPPPDAERAAAHVLARLPRVRQRGRWWPRLPALGRHSHVSDDAMRSSLVEEPPMGRLPIVRRRTMTMFSPVKAIVAGAVVALGGLLLVVQPVAQPEVSVPGAEMSEPPVAVSVAQECESVMATPVVCSWTAGDPRLTGTLTHAWASPAITARLLDDDMGIGWAPATLEGQDGNWTGHIYAVWGAPAQLFTVLSGDGAYQGWQFLASTIDSESPGNSTWTGIMYEGDPPPFGPLTATVD